jgi:hypothetical protein
MMPINMGLAALLMSGAMQSGEPATKLTLDADAISQPNGGASLTLVQAGPTTDISKKKGGKKQKERNPAPRKG